MTGLSHINAAISRSEWTRGARSVLIWLSLVISPLCMFGCASNLSESSFARRNSGLSRISITPNASKPVFVQRVSTRSTGAVDFELSAPNEEAVGRAQVIAVPESSSLSGATVYDPLQESAVLAGPVYRWTPSPVPEPLNFCNDFHSLRWRLFEELDALATCENAYFIGSAAGLALYLHDNVDNRVADNISQNGPKWGNVSDAITDFGHSFPVQLPLIGGMYLTSLWQQNQELHELSLTMFTTYKFTLLSSVALQYATRTHTSGSGLFDFMADSGFPSQQTSTSFALAAVVDEAFGWKAGLPAYLFAGLIGFSEVDQNQHRVSDVVFGAALGYVIGKSVGALHYRPDAPFKLIPLIDAQYGTQGLGIEYLF